VGSVLDSVDHASGAIDKFTGSLDYPNVAMTTVPMQNRPYSGIANTENVSYSEVLGENGTAKPLVGPDVTANPDDEMDIIKNCQQLAYFSTFSVGQDSPLGTAVYTGDLGPCSDVFNLGYGTSFTPHALTYFSLPFSFWKGSIVVKLVAVCTQYHRAKFQICSHVAFESAGLPIEQAFNQYTVTWDISNNSEIAILFPFRSATEWKKVACGYVPDARDYTMGQFSVRVLNPLTGIDQVSTTFEINVYMAGGPDYRLCHLGYNAIDYTPAVPAPSSTAVKRMGVQARLRPKPERRK